MVRRPLASALVALACVAVPLLGCRKHKNTGPAPSGSTESSTSSTATTFPRNETLYVGGRQWGEPSSFNPLPGWQDWPVNSMNLLYQTLLLYDPLKGELVPELAEAWDIKDDSVTITVNAQAKWNDGQPLTADDVLYTFELGKTFKTLPQSPMWNFMTGMKKLDAQRVVFELDPKQKNALPVLDACVEIRIVPKHVFEPLMAKAGNNIDEFTKNKLDKDPVGSGPYKLLTYSSEKIITVRDDNYWGNKVFFGGKLPAPKYIIHPIFKSNDHFSVGLQQGTVDTSASYLPRIQEKKNVRAWYDKPPYQVANTVPMLWVNFLHAPLDDVHLRRAMAFSINYSDIRELAVSGYSPPVDSGLILSFDNLEKKYFSPEDAKQYGAARFDIDAAKAELKAGGYTSTFKDGELVEWKDKAGKKLPTIYIKSPTGWTDWESIVRIAVKGMRQAGIDAREKFVDAGIFWGALYSADFDLVMFAPPARPSPSTPWRRFDLVMNSSEWAPEGEKRYMAESTLEPGGLS